MSTTVNLPAGHSLTVTAGVGESAIVVRVANPGDSTNYTATEISADSSAVIGPFADARVYDINSLVGVASYVVALADPTATSAGLAEALSNETGTGSAVFGTAPTITKASASGIVANLTTIGSGDSYTVPANSQVVIYDTLTVNGTVTVNGVLRTLDWPV